MAKDWIGNFMQVAEIAWPGAATLVWDGDDILDITTGRRGNLSGAVTEARINITYQFDRAIGLRDRGDCWAIAYANRQTKAVLMKNGVVHRELNRSFYCAEAYDYPIAMGALHGRGPVIVHCPNAFDLLVIEDVETGKIFDSLKSEEMEFHSRLSLSSDGKFLIDAGWFWHPWCSAAVFQLAATEEGEVKFVKNASPILSLPFPIEVDAVAFLGEDRLVVSSAPDYDEEPSPGSLGPKQLGIWHLGEKRWESIVDLSEPAGTVMPWKQCVVSFYGHPKLIELDTGKILHRWDSIYSGKQTGPINLGDPKPPAMALDPLNGRFAVACSDKVSLVRL